MSHDEPTRLGGPPGQQQPGGWPPQPPPQQPPTQPLPQQGQQPGYQQPGYGQPGYGSQQGYLQPGQPGGPGFPPGGPGYPGYGGPGGPGGPKKRTGLIVGLVVLAVLVIAGGITAFVLISKDDDNQAGDDPSETTSQTESQSTEASDPTVSNATPETTEVTPIPTAPPSDASTEDFCVAYFEILEKDGITDGTPEEKADAYQEWAAELERVGTPPDMPEDARSGYEIMIDVLSDVTPEQAADDSWEPTLSPSQDSDVEAFGDYAGTECLAYVPTDLPSTGMP